MDLGLGNLIELKRHLMNASTDDTRWDSVIADIGRGAAQGIETYCNRKFGRTSGAIDYFGAEVRHAYLQRYPVESVSEVAVRTDMQTGFVVEDSTIIINRDDKSGLLVFGQITRDWTCLIRVTYTGGYWYDTTETETGSMPSGATLLPYDVKLAWFLQCRRTWEVVDKLGVGLTQGGGAQPTFVAQTLGALELIGASKELLSGHIRYAMT